MMNLLLRHINRQCTLIRFPRGPVPADIMRYLDLDETSDTAMQALLDQAAADVNLTLSRCGDPRDDEGRLLHALLHHLPPC